MIRKILSVGLVIFWMGFIFSFSQSNGEESGSLSEEILTKVIEVVSDIEPGSERMEELLNIWGFPFRKCAHFFIYFVLGILVMNAFLAFGMVKKVSIIALIICILYAVSDEVHQMFVSDRSGNIKDILLDSSASCFAIYLFNRLIILRGKHEKKHS